MQLIPLKNEKKNINIYIYIYIYNRKKMSALHLLIVTMYSCS